MKLILPALMVLMLKINIACANTSPKDYLNKPSDADTISLNSVTEQLVHPKDIATFNPDFSEEKNIMLEPLTGTDIDRYPNGNIKSKTNYKDGRKHGLCKEYYENGNLQREAIYENGAYIETIRTYYKNGTLMSENIYDETTNEKVSKTYFDNGIVSHETIYKAGTKDGIYKHYSKKGNLLLIGNIKNGDRNGINGSPWFPRCGRLYLNGRRGRRKLRL